MQFWSLWTLAGHQPIDGGFPSCHFTGNQPSLNHARAAQKVVAARTGVVVTQLFAVIDGITLPGGELLSTGELGAFGLQRVPAELGDGPVLTLLVDVSSLLHLLEIAWEVERHLGCTGIPVAEHADVLG